MRAPLRAAAERSVLVRDRATRCAWRDRARCDAALRGIFFNALSDARARLVELRAVLRRAVLRPPVLVLRRVLPRAEVLREPAFRVAALRVDVLRADVLRADVFRAEVFRAEVLRAEVFRAEALEALRAEVLRVGEARRDEALRVVLRDDVALRDDVRRVLLRVPVLRVALARLPPERLADALRLVPEEREEPDRVDAAERLGFRDDFADDLRFGFSGTSTPARRASESPIAMACRAFFAPCLPLRIWSISRCTNSPAWVLADLPARLSRSARRIVSLSGMLPPERDERNLALQ